MQFPYARLYAPSLTSLAVKLALFFLLFSLLMVSAFTSIGGILSRPRWDVLVHQQGWLEPPLSTPVILLTDVPRRLEIHVKLLNTLYMSPEWIYSGSYLSMIDFDQSPVQMMKVSLDGREKEEMIEWYSVLETIEWSPDGKRYAYSIPHPSISNRFELFMANSDGADERKLTAFNIPFGMTWNFELTRGAFVWTKDSQSLLFTASKNAINTTSPAHYTDTLFRVDAMSGEVTHLADNLLNTAALAISPDGKQIAFTSTKDRGVFRLYVINSDGSGLRTVGDLPGEAFPVWSWDGKEVGYWVKAPHRQTFYALNLETSERRMVYTTDVWAFTPLWRP
jgi:Tol biopolymer transport system component